MDLSNPLVYLAIAGILVSAGIWIGKMESFKTSATTLLEEIRLDIKSLLQLPAKTFESKSPRMLTDLGKEISLELEVSDWAKEQSVQTLPEVKDKENFEIERFSFTYVANEALTSETFKRKIQRCAYERGLTDTEIQAVFAIELRDALLAMSGNVSV